MNGTTFLIEVLGVSFIAGMLWYARWQGQDDRRREEREEIRRAYRVIEQNERIQQYGYGISRVPDYYVAADWEQRAA